MTRARTRTSSRTGSARKVERPSTDQLEKAIKRLIELGVVETSLNFVALILEEREKGALCAILNYVCGRGLDLYDYSSSTGGSRATRPSWWPRQP